jgi:hypothetical protein
MTCQLLNRSRGCPTHGEMRIERMPERMDTAIAEPRLQHERYKKLIVEVADPTETVTMLRQAIGINTHNQPDSRSPSRHLATPTGCGNGGKKMGGPSCDEAFATGDLKSALL